MNVSFQPKIDDLYLENIFSLHSNVLTSFNSKTICLSCFVLFFYITMQLIKQARLNSNSQNSVCLRLLVHICVPPHFGETFLFFSLILNIFCYFSGIALEKERSCAKYLKTFSVQCLHTALGVISLSSYCSLRRQRRPGFAFILAYCSSF